MYQLSYCTPHTYTYIQLDLSKAEKKEKREEFPP